MEVTQADIVVIGSGPGGYAAAFYAADKGRNVVLVEKDERLGGVCLNRGCIPSKALLHSAKFIDESKAPCAARGIRFSPPEIDLEKLRGWKDSIVQKLAGGVQALARARKVTVLKGRGHFEDSSTLRIETAQGQKFLKFKKAIIATGSMPAVPAVFDLGNPRVMTSTEALELEEVPKRLLVIGGGYIGMELGTVYAGLGSEVTVVEALDSILTGADQDLVRFVSLYARRAFKEVRLGAKVVSMATAGKEIKVKTEVKGEVLEEKYDRVLVSVGRKPNSGELGLENTKVQLDEKGFIRIDTRQQTSDPDILAVGDVAGGLLLAHKASREARVAVETVLGGSEEFKDIVVPAVVYTDPEIVWCGLTEDAAKEKETAVEISKFPWAASGRAATFDRTDGLTKLILEPGTARVLGVGIAGAGAGELIGEGVLAVEMGATAEDLARSVHPHPTLSETLMEAAEAFYGTATHTAPRPKKK